MFVHVLPDVSVLVTVTELFNKILNLLRTQTIIS